MIELAIGVVAFGAARWGSAATVWASALSIPAAAVIAVLWIDPGVFYGALDTAGFRSLVDDDLPVQRPLADHAPPSSACRCSGVPWLAGLALRFSARAPSSPSASQVDRRGRARPGRGDRRLREEQARLARDVHDVVGHSLAVILAQAESAQYLDGRRHRSA